MSEKCSCSHCFAWRVARYIGRRLVRVFYVSSVDNCYLLKVSCCEAKDEVPDLDWRYADLEDWPRFSKLVTSKGLKTVRRRLENNEKCLIALDDKKLAAYSWVEWRKDYRCDDMMGITINVNQDSAYVFDGLTAPEYRKMGIGMEVVNRQARMMSEKGRTFLKVLIGQRNISSINMFVRMGAEKVGTYHYRRILWLRGWNFHTVPGKEGCW